MKEFLKESLFCDCNNKQVVERAIELTSRIKNDKEKAKALFYFVRDKVKYGFDWWNKKASETLAKKYGMCTNKSNLLIAMLRACEIPSGYGVLRVNAQEYFGPIMLPFFKNRVSSSSVHVYCHVYLDGKWIKCDPSTDLELSEKTSQFNYTTELVEWDAEHDAMDRIAPEHIIDDQGLFPNIDKLLQKKPKNFTQATLELANLYLEFFRSYKERFCDIKEIEKKFMKWLSGKSPVLYRSAMDSIAMSPRNVKSTTTKSKHGKVIKE